MVKVIEGLGIPFSVKCFNLNALIVAHGVTMGLTGMIYKKTKKEFLFVSFVVRRALHQLIISEDANKAMLVPS